MSYKTPKQIRDAANGPWPEPAATQARKGITVGEWRKRPHTAVDAARRAYLDALADIQEDPDLQDPEDPRDFDTW
jgi:hypothetical protein